MMEEKQKPDGQKQLVVDILGPDGRVRCTKCLLRVSTYSFYGNIAIQAFATAESRMADMDDGERLEPGEHWGVLTVNPAEELGDHVVCVKDYSEGAGNLRTLLDAGIVETPYRQIPSGFVYLPVCRLTPKGRDWVKSELARPADTADTADTADAGEGGESEKPAAGAYDLDKEFRHKSVSVTRRDYEGLPCPMAAAKVDDTTMQAIVDDTYGRLLDFCRDDKQMAAALSGRDGALDYMSDKIRGKYWEFMEQAAREHGMQYYEDEGDGDGGEKGAGDVD